MTGGLGFVKDGMNSHKSNRRMVNDLNEKHFKSVKTKSDFSRKYRENSLADPKKLKAIRVKARIERRLNLIKSSVLIVVALGIVVAAYFYLNY